MADPPIAGCAKDDRPDDVIKATWARAMVTAHSSNMDEAIEALKILCHELVGASIPGRASEQTVQLLKTSGDELVKELCLKLDQVCWKGQLKELAGGRLFSSIVVAESSTSPNSKESVSPVRIWSLTELCCSMRGSRFSMPALMTIWLTLVLCVFFIFCSH